MKTNYPLLRGGTLLGNVGGPKEHLILLCCDPIEYPYIAVPAILTVNVTSWKKKGRKIDNDPACILDVGDHPFIQHKSFVFYAMASFFSVLSLQSGLDDGSYKPQAFLSESVMRRVLDGFRKSQVLSDSGERFFRFLEKQGKV